MVGHNEGLWHFAGELAGDGKAASLSALHSKFPTGALASLRAPVDHWPSLAPGSATLVAFVRPRDLEKD
jgi:phosphohistidine phosphatase